MTARNNLTSSTMDDKTKAASSSPLVKIPTDQIQQVFAYLILRDVLSLSLCSKPIHRMAQLTHHLSSHSNNAGGRKSDDLRRSMPNISNMDPISSHEFGRRQNCFRNSMMVNRGFSITTSDMTVTRLTYCLNKFQYLRSLKLYHMQQMGDKFLPIINASMMKHTLDHLELHDVRIVRNGHVLTLPEDTSRLRHVEIHGTLFCCYKVLKSFTQSRNLEVLKMSGCRALEDGDVKDIIQKHAIYAKLRELSLENCSKISAPDINCTSLEILNLAKCGMIKDLSMIKCQNLVDVDLSYCSSFENGAIEKLLENNNMIEKLCVKGSRGFTSVKIQSGRLRDLDISMCMLLKTCTIICPQVTLLEMGMCVKLQDLHLELDAIKSLDLSMLTMTNIFISARELNSLNLSGCCKLCSSTCTVEQFYCPKMMELDVCGTDLSPDLFRMGAGRKMKIKSGGEVYDWTNPFRNHRQ